uniref:Lipocalin/cytosolic fatty-acid binding domain-containing protein n=1 Tax=Esox lucius TaxID=8010 RepID=A0AAY5KDM8_ESOLU
MTSPLPLLEKQTHSSVELLTMSTFKTIEIQFKLDEPFEETTPDGRETMSIFTLENGKLVQKQTWGGKETTIERQIADDGNTLEKTVGL